jgi:hypothetical protein
MWLLLTFFHRIFHLNIVSLKKKEENLNHFKFLLQDFFSDLKCNLNAKFYWIANESKNK